MGMTSTATDFLFCYSSSVSLFLYHSNFLLYAHNGLLHKGEEKKKAVRGGHTATLSSMLCWLGWTLPLRAWWGRMALQRSQPGASIAVIIIWIQDCWIHNSGPLHGWEMTCLCLSDASSIYRQAPHPLSATWAPACLRESTSYFIVRTGVSCFKPAV